MKYFILIFLFFVSLSVSSNERLKVALVPLFNIDVTDDYDYLEPKIYDSLTNEIKSSNSFDVISKEVIVSTFAENNFIYDRLFFDKDQDMIKEILNTNLNVTGFYKVKDRIFTLYFKGYSKNPNGIDVTNFEVQGDFTENIDKIILDASKMMKDLLVDKYVKNKKVEDVKLNLSRKKEKKLTFHYKGMNFGAKFVLPVGAAISIGGLVVFIYNLVGNSSTIDQNSIGNYSNYAEYTRAYNTFVGLFASGLSVMNFGFALQLTSIPLFIYKRNLNTFNKVGIGLYSAGVTILLGGITLISYDLSILFAQVRKAKEDVIYGFGDYGQYVEVYFTNLYFYIASVSSVSLGAIVTLISIPFLISRTYAPQKSNINSISLDIGFNKDLTLGLSYKF